MNNIFETRIILTYKEIEQIFKYSKQNKKEPIIIVHKNYGEIGRGDNEDTIKIAFVNAWLRSKKNAIFIRK